MGLIRLAKLVCVVLSVLLLLATATWMAAETRWARFDPPTPEYAFAHGTIGLETMPLKYALVIDKLSAPAFHTGREDGRSMWRTYGFIDNPNAGKDSRPACLDNAADKVPVGFGVSNFLPVRGVQTPVPFAGLTCTACHAALVRLPEATAAGPVVGMGNQELDVIAWGDGFRSAVLDPALSVDAILTAYDAQCGAPADLYGRTLGRLLEKVVIGAWLDGIRSSVGDDLSRYDLPYANAALKDARDIPAGPGRTRPFRSVVRVALNLPGAENEAMSKIPVVWEQAHFLRPRSQYDGSIGDPVTRSFTAAYASGASVEVLSKPQVVDDIKAAAAYSEILGIDVPVPGYSNLFPDRPVDPAKASAGFAVYQRHCLTCHGYRPAENQPWNLDGAARIHELSPVEVIGTDPARLTFRYADMLPLGIWTALPGWGKDLDDQTRQLAAAADQARSEGELAREFFWRRQGDFLALASRKYRLGHPLYFPSKELTYELGYINNPIPRAYLRAPYLHNGSVPTLRQLINLDPRPKRFCRGENIYDPEALGYVAPAPDAQGRCPDRQSFVFDVAMPGNGNGGHDYPWAWNDPARDPRALENLLEYLKLL